MINAISQYGGTGVKFVCMKCRLDRPLDGASSQTSDTEMRETMRQLFHQVCGMSAAIAGLTTQLTALVEKSSEPLITQPTPEQTQNPPNQSSPKEAPPTIDRDAIREEVREQREREKRRNSIIIKGLHATSANDVVTKFESLSEAHLGGKVTVTDVVKIPNQTHMYRANIMSDEHRKRVLDQARNLRGTSSEVVFISKDLTRAQRTAMYEKRKARRDALSKSTEAPAVTNQENPPPSDQGSSNLAAGQVN